jgi:hypothetical protein
MRRASARAPMADERPNLARLRDECTVRLHSFYHERYVLTQPPRSKPAAPEQHSAHVSLGVKYGVALGAVLSGFALVARGVNPEGFEERFNMSISAIVATYLLAGLVGGAALGLVGTRLRRPLIAALAATGAIGGLAAAVRVQLSGWGSWSVWDIPGVLVFPVLAGALCAWVARDVMNSADRKQ